MMSVTRMSRFSEVSQLTGIKQDLVYKVPSTWLPPLYIVLYTFVGQESQNTRYFTSLMVRTHCLNNPFGTYAYLYARFHAIYLYSVYGDFCFSTSTTPDLGLASKNFLYNNTILCQSLTRLCQVGCENWKHLHAYSILIGWERSANV